MRRFVPFLIALAALAIGGCDRRSSTGPVVISTLRGRAAYVDPGIGALNRGSALLMGATAQGLVALDATGQVEPALAERWIVIDGGASYIFRLRAARWNDGKPVTAEQVVAILRRQIGRRSDNPFARYLTTVDRITAMTPEIIEIDLTSPLADLLRILAQPALGVYRSKPPGGSGPFAIDHWVRGGRVLLRPAPDPEQADDEDAPKFTPADDVELISERASLAIVRFVAHRSDLVDGGSFVDWPLIAGTGVPPSSLHRDPAVGMFGLAIARRDGFLGDPANRAAVSEAFDRDAMLAAIAPDWASTTQLLPATLDSAAAPVVPVWSGQRLEDRRRDARARVAAWAVDNPDPITLRIALPDGPGATQLYGYLGTALLAIGITPERVAADAEAELRLVDRVAPVESARWYLVNACTPCSGDAVAAIEAVRLTTTPEQRAQAIAAADLLIGRDVPYIPLGTPLRWSMVAPQLDEWQANNRAWHPLNHLRARPN